MGSYRGEDNKFHADGVIVREVCNLEIVFWDTRSIYVYPEDGDGAIFHRWGHRQRGFYNTYWRSFRRKLLRRKKLTMLQVYELAATYDVLATRTAKRLDLSKVKVIRRD